MKKSDYVKDDILFAVIPEREKRGSEWKHFAQFKKNILLNKNVIKFPIYEKTNKLLRNQNFNNLLESTKVNHSLRLVSFKRFKYFNLKQRKWLSNRVKVQEHSERYLSILEVIRPSAKSLKGMRKVWKFKIKIAKMKRKKRKAFYKAKRKQFYKAKRKHFHKGKFKHFHNSKSKLIPSRRKWFKKKNENNKKLIVKEPLKKYYLVDDKLIVK